MMDDVRMLIGRVAYVFPMDHLRLSALSMRPIIEHTLRMFSFNSAALETPRAMFGEVPETMPPGVVFSLGHFAQTEGMTPTPIRFLHFEQRRLVIDVAGTTDAAEEALQLLSATLQNETLDDGSPLLSTPMQKLYYSEITLNSSAGLENLFSPQFVTLLHKYFMVAPELQLAPSILLPILMDEQEISAETMQQNSRTLQLSYRIGTQLKEHRLWSGAPLPTQQHMSYLAELDALLATAR